MVTRAKILDAAGDRLVELWRGVHADDRKRFGCKFTRTAMRKLERGQKTNLMAEAEKYKAKARDWSGFLEFVKGLVEVFSKLLPLFIK